MLWSVTNPRYAGFRHARPSLRKQRVAHGLTLDELAADIGYDLSRLAKVERGDGRLSPEIQRAIAATLNADMDELFEERAPPPTRDDDLRNRLVAAAGRCGAPPCQNAACPVPRGGCHGPGCKNAATLSRQTQSSARRVRGMPTLYCSMTCANRRYTFDSLRAQGLRSASDIAAELDRAPRNILRFGWELVAERRLGRQIPGTGPRGGTWFFTNDEVEIMRAHLATSPTGAVHRDAGTRGNWGLKRHKTTKMYGRLNRELAAEKGKTVGRQSQLNRKQLERFEEMAKANEIAIMERRAKPYSQRRMALLLSGLGKKGSVVSRGSIENLLRKRA